MDTIKNFEMTEHLLLSSPDSNDPMWSQAEDQDGKTIGEIQNFNGLKQFLYLVFGINESYPKFVEASSGKKVTKWQFLCSKFTTYPARTYPSSYPCYTQAWHHLDTNSIELCFFEPNHFENSSVTKGNLYD